MKEEYIEQLKKYLIKKKGLDDSSATKRAEESWDTYYKNNKEKIDLSRKKMKEAFDKSVDMEFKKLEYGLDD